MSPLTVLFICHNHPEVRPGGAEAYALELHRHLRAAGEFESFFLAKGGPPLVQPAAALASRDLIAPAERRQRVLLLHRGLGATTGRSGRFTHDKRLYTKHLRAFFQAVQPDIVHLHHTMFFGYDLLREIRNSVPDAPILYTLHEFMPICHRQGQMLRVPDDEPCMEESPRRCHECYPGYQPADLLHAEAVRPVTSLPGRSVHRAQCNSSRIGTSTGGFRRRRSRSRNTAGRPRLARSWTSLVRIATGSASSAS